MAAAETGTGDAAPPLGWWGNTDPAVNSVFGPESARHAEQLAALREQRMLLVTLRAQLHGGIRLVAASDPGRGWRSAAQRRYSGRLGDLREQLRTAAGQVDATLEAVDRALATELGRASVPGAVVVPGR